MRTLTRTVVSCTLALEVLSSGPDAAAQEPPMRAPSDAPAPVTVDGTAVNDLSDIEDASLEGLLDLSLEDKLGKTEAVSRTTESVLRAPAAMTTLDATQIRLSGARSVPEILRLVPGVTVVRNAPGNYVVSLRGTGGLADNNVILLVDGIPQNSPLDGGVSWDLIPLHVEDIQRIEVVRGPVSPTYGANAYTGVINIVTRTELGLSPGYVARVRGGSDLHLGTAGLASGRFVHVSRNYRLKAFLNAERDATSLEPSSESRIDSAPPLHQLAALTEFVFMPNRASRIAVEAGYVWSERSGMDHLALSSEPESRQLLFGRVLYEVQEGLGPLDSLRVWATGISFDIPEGDDPTEGFSYRGAQSFRAASGTDLVVSLGPYFSALLGGQGSIERVNANFIHPNVDEQLRPAYGVYAGLKATPLKVLDLVLTGRADLSPLSAELDYSYRASAIYHQDTWGMRLTGASSFRSPSYIESAGRFIDPATQLILLEGTDSIEAPRNTSIELGASFSPHSKLTLSSTVYVSRLSNLMVEDFDSVVRRTFQNDPDARFLLGAELEARWQVSDELNILPSFTWLEWLRASESVDTNVGVPSQNPRYVAGLQVYGMFANETWGYGLTGTLTAPRSYDVRAGIPPLILSKDLPANVALSAALEHRLVSTPSLWGSLRIGASLPGDAPESPLPEATPLGQSVLLGVEIRRE